MKKVLKFAGIGCGSIIALFVVVGIITAIVSPSDKDKNSTEATVKSASVGPEEKAEDESKKLSNQLETELKSFDKEFDATAFRGTIVQLQVEVAMFKVWADLIHKGEVSSQAADKENAKALKAKVIALQKKEFPTMRKEYAKIVADKLWENDIYVSTYGTGNRIITLSGAYFAANANIKQTQETLAEVLQQFRFTQAQYRWYKGADEFTYYDIDGGKDAEIME